MKLKQTAQKLAVSIPKGMSTEALRDIVDVLTGGELDAIQLDLLCDSITHIQNKEPTP